MHCTKPPNLPRVVIGKSLIGVIWSASNREYTEPKVTESSEDKTKRKLSKLLLDYDWQHQHSVFYRDIEESINLIDNGNKLKKILKKKLPTSPFLVCYRTLYRKDRGGLQAYVTIFSTAQIKKFQKIAMEAFGNGIATRGRGLSPEKLQHTESALKAQRLHDLEGFFGRKIRRYSIINKSELDRFKILSNEDQHDKPLQ